MEKKEFIGSIIDTQWDELGNHEVVRVRTAKGIEWFQFRKLPKIVNKSWIKERIGKNVRITMTVEDI